MNADSSTVALDVLDLDAFTKAFDSGSYDHLLTKKRKQTKSTPQKPKRVLIADLLPTEAIPFIEIVTCECCKKESNFLKSWGLKTYRPNGSSTTKAVDASKQKLFLELKKANKIGEAFITKVTYAECDFCSTIEEYL